VSFDRDLDRKRGSASRRADDLESSAQRFDAIGQPRQSCPLTGIGTPNSVVADRQLQGRVVLDYVDLHHRRMRVLGRVGERLRNRVVRRDLDVLGQSPLVTQFEFDRKCGTTRQRLERRS